LKQPWPQRCSQPDAENLVQVVRENMLQEIFSLPSCGATAEASRKVGTFQLEDTSPRHETCFISNSQAIIEILNNTGITVLMEHAGHEMIMGFITMTEQPHFQRVDNAIAEHICGLLTICPIILQETVPGRCRL
jgi:hypothetical protein